jgi:hypothetical protein
MTSTKCNIGVIYEVHSDLMPTSVIIELLPKLRKHGFDIFLFEEPSNRTPAQMLKAFSNSLSFLQNKRYSRMNLIDDPHIQTMKGAIELHTQLQSNGFTIKGIDLSEKEREKCDNLGRDECLKQRDVNFINNIKEVCKAHGNALFLVGLEHEKVVLELKQESTYNIRGFVPVANVKQMQDFVYKSIESTISEYRDHFGEQWNTEYETNIIRQFNARKIHFDHPESFSMIECPNIKDVSQCASLVLDLLINNQHDVDSLGKSFEATDL